MYKTPIHKLLNLVSAYRGHKDLSVLRTDQYSKTPHRGDTS